MSTQAPTLARLALGQMLVSLREAAGLDRAEVAIEMDVHPDTVRRWETGEHGMKKPVVRDIARLYNATSSQTIRMTTLAEQSKQRGAVERYPGGASPEFRMFADFEPTATQILSYEPEYVPGLLQTPEYLKAIHQAQLSDQTPKPEAVHQLRTSRHETMFSRDNLPELRFVIGVAAMIYLDALPHEVRTEQLAHLRKLGALASVEIRVITVMHPGMNGGFTIMTPADGMLSANRFAYIEAQDICRYVETAETVSIYDQIFRSVWDRAIPLEEYINGR
jgi:transcriptional regulator with XRE-family HTH domain